MIERITVIAMQGCRCPRERLGEPVITDCDPATVKRTPFYTRLLADGSLRIYQAQKPARAVNPPAAQNKKSEKTEKNDKTGGDK
jgi:hypothetical protein